MKHWNCGIGPNIKLIVWNRSQNKWWSTQNLYMSKLTLVRPLKRVTKWKFMKGFTQGEALSNMSTMQYWNCGIGPNVILTVWNKSQNKWQSTTNLFMGKLSLARPSKSVTNEDSWKGSHRVGSHLPVPNVTSPLQTMVIWRNITWLKQERGHLLAPNMTYHCHTVPTWKNMKGLIQERFICQFKMWQVLFRK